MFYDIFTNLCDKKGLSPTATLQNLGISTSKVTAWKNGSLPSASVLILLSEFFGVSVDYLLTGKEKRTKELPDDKQRLLKMYDLLTPMEKGEILGELKAITKNRTPRPDIEISQIPEKAIARSKGNPFIEVPTMEQIASFTPVPEDSDL